jgi:hypothetical protein
MFNMSQLPMNRLIELIEEAEYAFRTRGFMAKQIESSLSNPLDRLIFRMTQKRWVKRLGVGPLKNLGKRWIRARSPASSTSM